MLLVARIETEAAEVNAVIAGEMAEEAPSPVIIALFRRKRRPVCKENQVTHRHTSPARHRSLGAERQAPKYGSAFVKAALRIGTLGGMSRLKFYEKSIEIADRQIGDRARTNASRLGVGAAGQGRRCR